LINQAGKHTGYFQSQAALLLRIALERKEKMAAGGPKCPHSHIISQFSSTIGRRQPPEGMHYTAYLWIKPSGRFFATFTADFLFPAV
jgi:hypothetical protein